VKTNRKFTLVVRRVQCESGNKRIAPNPTYLFTAMEANYTKLHENASNPTDTKGRLGDRTALGGKSAKEADIERKNERGKEDDTARYR